MLFRRGRLLDHPFHKRPIAAFLLQMLTCDTAIRGMGFFFRAPDCNTVPPTQRGISKHSALALSFSGNAHVLRGPRAASARNPQTRREAPREPPRQLPPRAVQRAASARDAATITRRTAQSLWKGTLNRCGAANTPDADSARGLFTRRYTRHTSTAPRAQTRREHTAEQSNARQATRTRQRGYIRR